MTRRHVAAAVAIAATLILGGAYTTFWLLKQPTPQVAGDERINTAGDKGSQTSRAIQDQETASKISEDTVEVRLYVLGSSGTSFVVENEQMSKTMSLQQQIRHVMELLLSRSAAIPPEVELREVFLTSQGVVYVDLSEEFVQNHPGGSSAEELSIFGLSHTLIVNFPAVKMMKILIEGQEIQTLAGHMDLSISYGRAPDYLDPLSDSKGIPNETS